jgi:hypothetical protein
MSCTRLMDEKSSEARELHGRRFLSMELLVVCVCVCVCVCVHMGYAHGNAFGLALFWESERGWSFW